MATVAEVLGQNLRPKFSTLDFFLKNVSNLKTEVSIDILIICLFVAPENLNL